MKQAVIFGLALVIIAGVGIWFLNTAGNLETNPELLDKNKDTGLSGVETPEELQQKGNPDGPTNQGESSGGDNGGGSGGGDSKSEESTCNGPQISYALGNFESTETCNTYQGQTCTDKTLNCTVEVSNFDPSISGEFGIEFSYFYGEGISKTTIGTENTELNLGPGETKITSIETTITGTNADKDLDCSALTTKVPRRC